MEDKEVFTVREIAERYSLSRSFIYRLIESNGLRHIRVSRRKLLVRKSDFEEFLTRFECGGGATSRRRRRTPSSQVLSLFDLPRKPEPDSPDEPNREGAGARSASGGEG